MSLAGGYFQRRVCAGGGYVQGEWVSQVPGGGQDGAPHHVTYSMMHMILPTPAPPPLPGQSHANKNIIFWQLLLRAVRISRTQCAKTKPHVLLMKISCRFIDNKVFLAEI